MEKIFKWGSHCYVTSTDNIRLIFIRGIYSGTNAEMKEFIHFISKYFKNNTLQVKKFTKFNESLFRSKVYTQNFKHSNFEEIFEKNNIKS